MINIKKISVNQTIGWKRDFRRQSKKCNKEIDKKEFAKSKKRIGIGFSLCPFYSLKQLQRINTVFIKKTKYGHKNKIVNIFSVRKQVLTRNAFNQEAIL
jgi:hypothetical protein